MWDFKYFKRSEFACKCGCGDAHVQRKLVTILEKLREYYGKPITINSGKRCAKHNKAVGGAKFSKHLTGEAADIRVQGVPPSEVYKYLDEKYSTTLGLGNYNTFTHIDIRAGRTRW